MIKVTLGPTVQRYADCYGIPPAEVVDWINSYIRHDGEHREATEESRRDSIFEYVKDQVNCSTYGRIKQALDHGKN